MIEAVLFDLDETLIDKTAALSAFLPSQHRRFRLGKDAVDEQRYVSEFLELEKAGFVRKRDLYPRLARNLGFDDALAAALFQDFEDIYPSMAVAMSGAKETLSALKNQGFLVGIVSNGESNVQTPKIAAAGLAGSIDVTIISGDVGLRKPAAEIFQLAAKRLNVPVENCLFVGDNPQADILGAQNAGMRAVYFRRNGPWPASLPSPRYQIEALTELVALVRKLNASDEMQKL